MILAWLTMMLLFRAASLAALAATASSFVAPSRRLAPLSSRPMAKLDADVEAAVKKGGVEGGLFSIFKSDADGESKGASAKALLKEYGAAYVSTRVALDRPFSPRASAPSQLVTSISLAIVSFSICYALIDQGVDAAALLAKVNIDATSATEKGTTVAIAYAIHKAASPIRRSPRARARRAAPVRRFDATPPRRLPSDRRPDARRRQVPQARERRRRRRQTGRLLGEVHGRRDGGDVLAQREDGRVDVGEARMREAAPLPWVQALDKNL